MSGLVMVIEHVETETGDVLGATRTDRHGWDSPLSAVRHWKATGRFEAFRNGRIER